MGTMNVFIVVFASFIAAVCGQLLITTSDAFGDTIVESVGINLSGLATTVLQTLAPGTTSIATAASTAASTAATSATTLPTSSIAALTTQQQGPVGQPAATAPNQGETPYTYTTTDANGDYTAVTAIFTPTFAATQLPVLTTTGTILDYSEWIGLIGNATTGLNGASASQGAALSRTGTGSLGVVVSIAAGIIGGAMLVLV